MSDKALPPLASYLSGRLPPDLAKRLNRIRGLPGIKRMALMPDAHIAGKSAVGLVVATREVLYPMLVGEDLGCGMASVRLNSPSELPAGEVLARLQRAVPIHRHRDRQHLPDSLGVLSSESLTHQASRDGAVQFATLGTGNHFLELQIDTDGGHWLTVHTGSRGMGGRVAQPMMESALAVGSAEANAYLHDLAWCRRYADASRREILAAAARALERETDARSLIATDHNHVAYEDGVFVHRKGATPAPAGSLAIIAGSMGTATFHIEGRGDTSALNSASHGAGRRLTRTEARAEVSRRDLRRQMADVIYDLRLESSLVEEAPSAYRDIRAVLRAQRDLLKQIRELKPLVVHKG